MLAVVWANELINDDGPLDPDFDGSFGSNEQIARQIVNRAIDDWNAVLDTNFDQDNNPLTGPNLELTILAQDFGEPGLRGDALINSFTSSTAAVNGLVPSTGRIRLDDDAGGGGWFFDQTPLDDGEFSSIADTFQGSFVDASSAGQAASNDLYRTILHEIGHTLGGRLASNLSSGNFATTFSNTPANPFSFLPDGPPVAAQTQDNLLGSVQYVGTDQVNIGGGLRIVSDPDGVFPSGDETAVIDELWQYTFRDGTGRTVTFTENGGGHFYEGPLNANTPGADQHLNELMNAGRTVPSGGGPPIETTRQFISDLTAEFLADAYGYDLLNLPSTLDSAHATLDTLGGTLLVQGSPRDDTGAGSNDTISVSVSGDDVVVTVTTPSLTTTERFERDRVRQIVIAGHGGTDSVSWDSSLNDLVQSVDYVVSSNEDALDSGVLGDGIVDLDPVVPGQQTTLRAAVRDANTRSGGGAVYLPPSPSGYALSLLGVENQNASANDLDIFGDVTLIGAGPGVSVIDSSALSTAGANGRHFDIRSSGVLSLSNLTVKGGDASASGGISVAGELVMDTVAVADNTFGAGGGIDVINNATATITNSVITGNTGTFAGGILIGETATVSLGSTIVANNVATSGAAEDILSKTAGPNSGDVTSLGDNIISTLTGTLGITAGVNGDRVENPEYIVTSVADTVHGEPVTADDAYALGLREALEKIVPGSVQTVLVPGWDFVVDTFLVVRNKTRMIGISDTATTVTSLDALDRVFAIIGDFNSDGQIDNADLNLLLNEWGGDGSGVPEWEAYFMWNEGADAPIDNAELNDMLSGWGFGTDPDGDGVNNSSGNLVAGIYRVG